MCPGRSFQRSHMMLSLPLPPHALSSSSAALLQTQKLSCGSQNTAGTFLPQGLCPSSACCFEHPFPKDSLDHLPHSNLKSVPISPSQCSSQLPSHTPDPPFYSTYCLLTHHLVHLLISIMILFIFFHQSPPPPLSQLRL